MGFLIRFARQWIAGESLDEAIKSAKKANENGILAIINFLGEHVKDEAIAENNLEENLRILYAIEKSRVNASLSIKLTQLGLDIQKELCLSYVNKIVSNASLKNIFVWIDMESSHYTQDTIDIYLDVIKRYKNVGIAIQANLKRSEHDVKSIAASKGIIRLVKGAYKEKEAIAYTNRNDITLNFSRLMGNLFYKTNAFAIATHDELLINEAIEANKTHQKRIEFQMLMGVRSRLKHQLVKNGFVVAEYIPYGREWFPYTLRRVKERKRNIILILRSLLDI